MIDLNKALLFGAVALASVSPAMAQQSVEEYLVEGVRKNGVSDADIARFLRIQRYDDGSAGNGLNLQSAIQSPAELVAGEQNPAFLAVIIRNPTREAWCVRAKGGTTRGQIVRSGVTFFSFIVKPGEVGELMHAEIHLDPKVPFDGRWETGVASWRPDMSRPTDDHRCAATQPARLDEWLAAPGIQDYAEFERATKAP